MAEETKVAEVSAEPAAAPAAAAAPAKPAKAAKKAAKAPAAKKAAAPKKEKAPAAPKAPKSPKPKKAAAKTAGAHPPYLEMVVAAVKALKERSGSSRQAILKYILANYAVGTDPKAANLHLKQALKRGVTTGALKNTKVNIYPLFLFFCPVLYEDF
jgi:histone H1/5